MSKGSLKSDCIATRLRLPADFLLPHRGPPRDLAGPQEVVAHHRLRRFAVGRFAVTQSRRNLLLMLVGKNVEVSPGLKMQERSHAMMEGQRPLRILFLGAFKSLSNPVRPMKIAHAARRVLQVGLELKNRVTEAFIPHALGFKQARAEKRPDDAGGNPEGLLAGTPRQ